MASDKNALRYVPVSSVRPNPAALRQVNKESEDFLEFLDSIRSKGILQSLLVRESKDKESGTTYYALIDGLHRYTAAVELGLDAVPVHIISADDDEALESQIVTNLHTIETKPAEYAKALQRLLAHKETLTIPELAGKLGKSVTWLSERLKLVKLPEKVKTLVDEGKINVTNAQALANLPEDEVNDFVDKAMTMAPGQFVPMAKARAKEVRDAANQGRERKPKEFTPTPFLQGVAAIRDEAESLAIGKSLINQHGASTPLDGWHLALKWAMHMDPGSIDEQRRKYEEQEAEKKERREAAKAEKSRKKQEEAAEVAATL